jgi:hypothetical protein
MIFRHTQPKTENDIKSNGDCMIRAVTIITNSEYGKVHKLMYNNGWRSSKRTVKDWESQITNTLVDLGFSYERISFPGIKGEKRMTAKTLSKIDPEGKYIIRVSKHVSALDGGTLLDTWDCSDKCVYFVWKIK